MQFAVSFKQTAQTLLADFQSAGMSFGATFTGFQRVSEMDLTMLTVTPETLAEGVIAMDAAGKIIIGTLKITNGKSAALGTAELGKMELGVD